MSNNRSIFEEVSEKTKETTPQGGLIDQGRSGWRKPASIWILILFILVAAMILVGGLTRLTDSGLSITEWAPIKGAIPPLSEAAWLVEFEKYKAIPEFQLQNSEMNLGQFKEIYWWEWGHRQLGRLVGLVWAVGVLFLLFTQKLPPAWRLRFLLIGALGGLQGFLGWWMVSSGLEGARVDVSSIRLAIHLGLAFIILSILAWYMMLLRNDEMALFQARRNQDSRMSVWARYLMIAVFVQIILGALVAGIDAGRGYIDWPMMNGAFLPSESFDYQPVWKNFVENPALVQFNHRILGYLVFLLALIAWLRARTSPHREVQLSFLLVFSMISLQMVLGIVTVLYAAPLNLAILHQLGAIVTIVLVLKSGFASVYPMGKAIQSAK